MVVSEVRFGAPRQIQERAGGHEDGEEIGVSATYFSTSLLPRGEGTKQNHVDQGIFRVRSKPMTGTHIDEPRRVTLVKSGNVTHGVLVFRRVDRQDQFHAALPRVGWA